MGNTSWDNDGAGIAVETGGENNRIFKNTAFENDTLDFADYGTDNRWWNNEYESANW
jgi:parallel beta-helix repeat protein